MLQPDNDGVIHVESRPDVEVEAVNLAIGGAETENLPQTEKGSRRPRLLARLALRTGGLLSKPAVVLAIGLGSLAISSCLWILVYPTYAPSYAIDCEQSKQFAATTFEYASSPLDVSVMSPYQASGAMVISRGGWLNLAYVVPRLLPSVEPNSLECAVVVVLSAVASFLLARAVGLPYYLQVLCTQVTVLFLYSPWARFILYGLNIEPFYIHVDDGTVALIYPTALGTTFVGVFCFLGTLSRRGNIACLALFVVLPLYALLCDSLHTPTHFFVPALFFVCGVYFASPSRQVLYWRTAGGLLCLALCLAANIPGFYLSLAPGTARGSFPHEIGAGPLVFHHPPCFLFLGGGPTCYSILILIGCGLALVFGTRLMRGFALSVIGFIGFLSVFTFLETYGGLDIGNYPQQKYYEEGAYLVYVVAGVLGWWLGLRKVAKWVGAWKPAVARIFAVLPLRLSLLYSCVLLLPAAAFVHSCFLRTPADGLDRHLGVEVDLNLFEPAPRTVEARAAAHGTMPDGSPRKNMVTYLQDQLALERDGRFRGSVACVLGVPGGELMRAMRVPDDTPCGESQFIARHNTYFRTFDPCLFLACLWNLRIPTLEDNGEYMAPPYYFLLSRALTRSQDYHVKNWGLLTKVRPHLMAALGTRFLLTDTAQENRSRLVPKLVDGTGIALEYRSDTSRELRATQTNQHGVTLYLYEIANPNLGDFSPARTVTATDASLAVSYMKDENFPFGDVAIIHEQELTGLKRAHTGAMFWERGGLRVRAESSGQALLVLPLQFSNCLRIISTDENSQATPIRLLRVNLMQTGVLFDGKVDFKIAHIFGPFRGVAGRKQDVEDYRRLGIKETGELRQWWTSE